MTDPRIPPTLDSAFVIEALGVALAGALADADRESWVVGLSGRLDDAVGAALAAETCGPGAVHGIHLPDSASSTDEADAVHAIADRLEISLETVTLDALLDAAPVPLDDRRRRNDFADRLRAAILHDRATTRRGLVLGTRSKSALAIEPPPRRGDAVADLWVLGDLYETQVGDLAEALGIPTPATDRTASVQPRADRADAGEPTISYGAADAILYYYLDERRRPDEIVERGHSRRTVEAVLSRVRSGAFERRLPPTPKLSYRTVGHDFLHPRVWRDPA